MSKSIVRKGIEATVPGAGLVSMGFSIVGEAYRHPIRTMFVSTLVGSVALGGIGYAKGFAFPSIKVENHISAEDHGRADVIEFNLDLQPTPLLSFTAAAKGSETTLNQVGAIKAGWIDTSISLSRTSLVLSSLVDVTPTYDPEQVTFSYAKNMIDDPEDDQLIERVPLAAFSTNSSIRSQSQTWEIEGDIRSLPSNIATAWADSIGLLNDVPGLGAIAKQNHSIEQTLVGFSAINTLADVTTVCTPEVLKNPTVNDALHDRIADDMFNALDKTDIPELDDMKLSEIKAMERVILIGDETLEERRNLKQEIVPSNEYTKAVEKLEENANIDLATTVPFECSLSDEIKQKLADDAKVAGGTTARAQEETRP